MLGHGALSELPLSTLPAAGGLSASAGLATEASLSSALGRVKAKSVGLAVETALATALARVKALSVGRSDEIDSAYALAREGIEPPAETVIQPSGGWGAYNDRNAERQRRKWLKRQEELEEEADRLEALLIAEKALPPNPELEARITVREYADYVTSRRTQRAVDYALRAKTALAYQLAAREIAKELEDEEHAVLMLLAMN